MARPSRPHHLSWNNQPVPGLSRCPDGRWRLRLNGKDVKFSEPDERKAVARYLAMIGESPKVSIPLSTVTNYDIGNPDRTEPAKGPGEPGSITALGAALAAMLSHSDTQAGFQVDQLVPEAKLWEWLREKAAQDPDHAAKMMGISKEAIMSMRKPSIRLSHLADVYRDHSDSKAQSKREALKTFDEFIRITGATTLEDLSADVLKKYREAIRKRCSSPATIAAYFGRVKWIIAFGKSEGEDAAQIDAALSRLAVLKAPKDDRTHEPTPITRAAFHKLLEKASPEWQARLLMMLNAALHFDECLDVEWGDFDLDAGTFCTRRNKRGKVIRAAMLWPETVKALRAIPRTGSNYVFVSTWGTRYNAKGQWKMFDKLRTEAGCPDVQMDDIRDGS